MTQIDEIIRLADIFAAARGISVSRVSTLVFNDGKRIAALRDGKDMGVRNAQRAFQWLSDNWPEGAVWPKEIERPAPASPFPGSEPDLVAPADREVA